MTSGVDEYAGLIDGIRARRPAALARAVSMVENRRPGADIVLAALHDQIGHARRIGVTGPPGAGKSTLTVQLASAYRERGLTVGIVAVDPTSPFTGGALLGDRVRMEAVALDPGVFIRSMATRGSLGGLAGATRDVCDLLDAYGFDRILIETVGVGQSELEISRTADTSVLVLMPESGDAIQTLKAGVMEIADIFVVNKADRSGADRLVHELEMMIGMRSGRDAAMPAHHGLDLRAKNPARRAREAASSNAVDRWTPPVLKTVANTATGIGELLAALDRQFVYLEASGELRTRRLRRLTERVRDAVHQRVRERLWSDPRTQERLKHTLPALEAGTISPFAVADELLKGSADLLSRNSGVTQ
jgi:LAO/AO transport system kinase